MAGSVVFQIASLKWMPLLKWCISNQTLCQAYALQKKNCQEFHSSRARSLIQQETEKEILVIKTNCISHRWQISSYVQGQKETIQARAHKMHYVQMHHRKFTSKQII